MPQPQAAGNPVRFVQETTATNAAAPTSEGAAKPESALVFGETSEPVRKIARVLPVSDELLEDAPQIAACLNQRLQLFVQIQEEAQLLLGNGTAPNIQGFIGAGRNTVGTFARGTADDNATALFKSCEWRSRLIATRSRHRGDPSHQLAWVPTWVRENAPRGDAF